MLKWTVHLKGAAAVVVGHEVLSFQDGSNTPNNAVHVFNTASLRWRKLPPLTPGRGECPFGEGGLITHHGRTAVLIEYIVYIWGGLIDVTPLWDANMLYAFNVDTHRWFKPSVSGTVPEGRRGPSACVLGKAMFIHGGWTELTGHTNDTYKLDTATMVWSVINTRGPPPPASEGHSATIIGTKMFVFGGHGVNQMGLNSIRVFDTETDVWLSTPSSAQLLPEERWNHSSFTYNGELYIFGGCCGDRSFNDLWTFSPETFSWKEVEPKENGLCPMRCAHCCIVEEGVVLFGGYRHGVVYPPTDDLYVLFGGYRHGVVYPPTDDLYVLFGGHRHGVVYPPTDDLYVTGWSIRPLMTCTS